MFRNVSYFYLSKKIGLFCLLLILASLMTVIAYASTTITYDFSPYDGQPAGNISEPRITVSGGGSVGTNGSGKLVATWNSSLVITLDSPAESVQFTTKGWGWCQTGSDNVSLYSGGNLVHSVDIFDAVTWGRCSTDNHSFSGTFDKIVLTVEGTSDNTRDLFNLSITWSDIPASDIPAASAFVYPPDERINWQFGDLGVVLYRNLSDPDNPAIDAYCYDGENSWLGMRVDDSTAYGTSANGCDVTFYIGDDGVYQFNINYDGKLYEIRCEDLYCFEPDMSYYDPNE